MKTWLLILLLFTIAVNASEETQTESDSEYDSESDYESDEPLSSMVDKPVLFSDLPSVPAAKMEESTGEATENNFCATLKTTKMKLCYTVGKGRYLKTELFESLLVNFIDCQRGIRYLYSRIGKGARTSCKITVMDEDKIPLYCHSAPKERKGSKLVKEPVPANFWADTEKQFQSFCQNVDRKKSTSGMVPGEGPIVW